MNILKLTSVFILFGAATACATSKPALEGQLSSDFGAAVKHNIAAHAVKPTDAQKSNTYIPANPVRAALARKKYEENTISEIDTVDSRSSSGPGSSN